MIIRPRNTKEKGLIEALVYKEGDSYIGVCLTFDIVEEGSDPVALAESIKEAARLHLETVIKNNLSDELLNRYAPEEYWKKYFEAAKEMQERNSKIRSFPIVSPYSQGLSVQFS